MAIDAFLKLGDIKGEATDDKHKEEIQILSWGFGINFVHDASGPTGRGGRADFGDLSLTKAVDISSPLLYLHCASGAPIEQAKLCLQSATGTSKVDFMTVELEDVHVTAISPGGSGDRPMEAVTLSFGTVKWTYSKLDPKTGSQQGQQASGWDLREKKKL